MHCFFCFVLFSLDVKVLKVYIEFSLDQPKGGLHFVVPDVEGSMAERGAHVFSFGFQNSTRCHHKLRLSCFILHFDYVITVFIYQHLLKVDCLGQVLVPLRGLLLRALYVEARVHC